ncbi:MAG TPA: CHAP domain-containing protein [Spirillospora sp.]
MVLGTAAATAQASALPFAPSQITADRGDAKAGKGDDGRKDDTGDRARSASKGKAEGKASGDPNRPKGDDRGNGREGDARGRGGNDSGRGAPANGPGRLPARPTAAQAIELARSQVGTTEDANGETKYNRWYMESRRAKETVARDGGSVEAYRNAAWCDMFISWLGDRLGFTDQFGSDAWTIAHARWFQEQDRWGTEPRPGAIVFYAWNGGKNVDDIVHIGIVTRKINDGTIEAVEGNSDGAVRIRQRPTGTVVGYGYPRYRS